MHSSQLSCKCISLAKVLVTGICMRVFRSLQLSGEANILQKGGFALSRRETAEELNSLTIYPVGVCRSGWQGRWPEQGGVPCCHGAPLHLELISTPSI